jgi:hypothetical protein
MAQHLRAQAVQVFDLTPHVSATFRQVLVLTTSAAACPQRVPTYQHPCPNFCRLSRLSRLSASRCQCQKRPVISVKRGLVPRLLRLSASRCQYRKRPVISGQRDLVPCLWRLSASGCPILALVSAVYRRFAESLTLARPRVPSLSELCTPVKRPNIDAKET